MDRVVDKMNSASHSETLIPFASFIFFYFEQVEVSDSNINNFEWELPYVN